jgi:guanylate kinase
MPQRFVSLMLSIVCTRLTSAQALSPSHCLLQQHFVACCCTLGPKSPWPCPAAKCLADSEEQITTRLRNAQEEVESIKEPGLYDCVIVNADLEQAYRQLSAIAQRALAGEIGGPESSAAGSAAAGGALPAGAALAAASTSGHGGGEGAAAAEPGSSGRASTGDGSHARSPVNPLGSAATFKQWLQPGGDGQSSHLGSPPAEQQVC